MDLAYSEVLVGTRLLRAEALGAGNRGLPVFPFLLVRILT
jgi:hypothetical protein